MIDNSLHIKVVVFLFILFSMLIRNPAHSQLTFYIAPEIYAKTNTSSLHINPLNKNLPLGSQYNILQNDFFMFTNNRIHFGSEINFGLKAGVRYKKNYFEIGFSSDHSSISHTTTAPEMSNLYYSTGDIPIYTYSDFGFIVGSRTYYKFSLDYNRLFWQDKNQVFRLSFGLGSGILFNKYVNKKKNMFDIQTYDLKVPEGTPDQYVSSHILNIYGRNRFTFYLRLNSEISFSTKKGVELFSINISYLRGLNYTQYGQHIYTVYDYGDIREYMIFQFSRGSGFYFQISRKFQLYPWIPLSKKKRLAKEKEL